MERDGLKASNTLNNIDISVNIAQSPNQVKVKLVDPASDKDNPFGDQACLGGMGRMMPALTNIKVGIRLMFNTHQYQKQRRMSRMAYLPIIQKHRRSSATTHHRRLPAFYMEDYSILGFQVSDCDRAIRILDQHHLPLKRIEEGVEVGVDGPAQMHEVMQLIRGGGLECEIADVAEGIYQG